MTLSKHSDATAEDFAHFLEGLGEVLAAHSVAGDADYLLHIRVRSLDELGEFVLKRLLPHPHVHQVRSDIVLKTIKENRGFRIAASAAGAQPSDDEADTLTQPWPTGSLRCRSSGLLVPRIQRARGLHASRCFGRPVTTTRRRMEFVVARMSCKPGPVEERVRYARCGQGRSVCRSSHHRSS